MGAHYLLESSENLSVDLFYQVVTTLVQSIDRAFYLGDLRIAGSRVTSFIFFVPEIKVCPMLGANYRGYLGRTKGLFWMRQMPCFCRFVVHPSDENRIEHRIIFGEFSPNSISLQTSGSCEESLAPAD